MGTLIPVSDDEWNEIKQHPHHFSLMTMVYSQTSVSTEKRLINHSKTKVKNKCTGMSLEQCNIENTLSSLNHILSGFELYPYPLVMDISKAYLRILVPYSTSKLRLFLFYEDLEKMTGLKIYRRGTLDFGDTIAGRILRLGVGKIPPS